MEYILDEIESCECIGLFNEEIVYDIEMADESHTFIANDILVHNTDSLYLSYKDLIDTIEGSEKLALEDKLKIILKINTEFLDKHNRNTSTNISYPVMLDQILQISRISNQRLSTNVVSGFMRPKNVTVRSFFGRRVSSTILMIYLLRLKALRLSSHHTRRLPVTSSNRCYASYWNMTASTSHRSLISCHKSSSRSFRNPIST